jgi:hypothetical protein
MRYLKFIADCTYEDKCEKMCRWGYMKMIDGDIFKDTNISTTTSDKVSKHCPICDYVVMYCYLTDKNYSDKEGAVIIKCVCGYIRKGCYKVLE